MNTFTPRKLTDAVKEGRSICEGLNIPIGCVTEIEANPRLTATWGRCKRLTEYTYRVEVKSRLLEQDVPHEVLMNTVLHELLHTCKGCMNHGAQFKRYAARLNAQGWNVATYVTAEEREAVPEPEATYKYRATCCSCGQAWSYQRRGAVVRSLQRDPHSCTCPCGSREIKLITLA